jgi:hypothetical protein
MISVGYIHYGDIHEQVPRHQKRNQEKAQAQPEGKKTVEKIEELRLISLIPRPFSARGASLKAERRAERGAPGKTSPEALPASIIPGCLP